jgi:hypothetical protein
MMYEYGFHSGGMAEAFAGPDILGLLTWIVVIVDLILVGFWLWKQIKKDTHH